MLYSFGQRELHFVGTEEAPVHAGNNGVDTMTGLSQQDVHHQCRDSVILNIFLLSRYVRDQENRDKTIGNNSE